MVYLKHFGVPTIAVVQSMYKSGSKGKFGCKYTYSVAEIKYSEHVIYKDVFEVYDSITILYIPIYPKISAPQRMILDYY